MTIACCYVSPEGVILGADSTASYGNASGMRHYNHNQKIFEIGNDASVGAVTWGLGGLGALSYRTLFARLADEVGELPGASVSDIMAKWIEIFGAAYAAFLEEPHNKPAVDWARELSQKTPFVKGAAPDPSVRTEVEEQHYQQVANAFTVGFCLAGCALPDRTPKAFYVHFQAIADAPPEPTQMPDMGYEFWGAPNIFQRLINGADDATREAIVSSPQWTGTEADLNVILERHSLGHPIIPLRDAVDFVYMCIYSTIKALKFSNFPPFCGGPIEVAVVSTDRPYRWVRHKAWDVALADGRMP